MKGEIDCKRKEGEGLECKTNCSPTGNVNVIANCRPITNNFNSSIKTAKTSDVCDDNVIETGVSHDKLGQVLRLSGGCDETLYGFFQNVTSIAKNLEEFKSFFECGEFDIIGIAETWLKEGHYDSEFAPDCYQVFRKDRSTRSGGVLLLIKDKLQPVCISLDTDLEVVAAKMRLRDSSLTIVVTYLPPPLNREAIDKLEFLLSDILANGRPQDKIIVMGDFNTPLYNPTVNAELNSSYLTRKLITTFSALDCKQFVTFPTCNNHFLDLIWSNTSINVQSIEQALPSIHQAISLSIPIRKKPFSKNKAVKDYNFFKTGQLVKNFLWKLLGLMN